MDNGNAAFAVDLVHHRLVAPLALVAAQRPALRAVRAALVVGIVVLVRLALHHPLVAAVLPLVALVAQ